VVYTSFTVPLDLQEEEEGGVSDLLLQKTLYTLMKGAILVRVLSSIPHNEDDVCIGSTRNKGVADKNQGEGYREQGCGCAAGGVSEGVRQRASLPGKAKRSSSTPSPSSLPLPKISAVLRFIPESQIEFALRRPVCYAFYSQIYTSFLKPNPRLGVSSLPSYMLDGQSPASPLKTIPPKDSPDSYW
jgi:hypothetical protein